MTATKEDRRAAHQRALENFIEKLELEGLPAPMMRQENIMMFNWPASNNGTEHDRTIIVIVHPDGSWNEYMSTGRNSIHETVIGLRLMAQAY